MKLVREQPEAGHLREGAIVLPPFERGSLFLKNEKSEIIRLVWEPIEGWKANPRNPKTAHWRPLPEGQYDLIGYRVIREDKEGAEWILSGLNPKGVSKHSRFTLAVGQSKTIELDPAINIAAKGVFNKEKNQLRVQVPIMGQNHTGLSIYKKGKRIPMSYRAISRGVDKPLEEAKLNYG